MKNSTCSTCGKELIGVYPVTVVCEACHAAQEITHDFIEDFGDLPDAAFFALAEELNIDLTENDD